MDWCTTVLLYARPQEMFYCLGLRTLHKNILRNIWLGPLGQLGAENLLTLNCMIWKSNISSKDTLQGRGGGKSLTPALTPKAVNQMWDLSEPRIKCIGSFRHREPSPLYLIMPFHARSSFRLKWTGLLTRAGDSSFESRFWFHLKGREFFQSEAQFNH